ncbi:MAG TPA: nucleoside-triphosphatase [Clostridia bacterium]|nr:nucleoside-triphosphatase [Clostridia bacterium]
MNGSKHILICGEVGAGKSTLITRLLAHITRPVYGFLTKKLSPDENSIHPVYIHPAGSDTRLYEEYNLVGTCDKKIRSINLNAFNTLGVDYLKAAQNGIIVMDELGFMEADAEAFTSAVFRALDGSIPVIAAVKARFDIPFLNDVRSHQNAKLYIITKDNRDELFKELLPIVLMWNEMSIFDFPK